MFRLVAFPIYWILVLTAVKRVLRVGALEKSCAALPNGRVKLNKMFRIEFRRKVTPA